MSIQIPQWRNGTAEKVDRTKPFWVVFALPSRRNEALLDLATSKEEALGKAEQAAREAGERVYFAQVDEFAEVPVKIGALLGEL